MDRKREEGFKPNQSQDEVEREAEKSREKLDEIPPPGTDPLHEGP
jgi:hypothetical protein